MRAAAVDASVLIETCASMLETVVDARERMCYHLCQRAAVVDAHERVLQCVLSLAPALCHGSGCAWACALSLNPA